MIWSHHGILWGFRVVASSYKLNSLCVRLVCAAAKLGKSGCGWTKYSYAEQRKMNNIGL